MFTLLVSKRRLPVIIFGLLLGLLFFLRYQIVTLAIIGQTYLTWHWKTSSTDIIGIGDHFDASFNAYALNQSSAAPEYPDLVPGILHHIVVGDIDLKTRPEWIAARQACYDWHPEYEHMFWDDARAESFIAETYPWFFEDWKSYPYPIQRADSLRYLILYRYGGIFLDMDLHCTRSLGPLRRFEFVAPAAFPVGVSNGFLMSAPYHPFTKALVDNLQLFNRKYFFLPYATVMFSTGCMYISAQFTIFSERWRLRILGDATGTHRLSGNVTTPLFIHDGSSSWHAGDAAFIQNAAKGLKSIGTMSPLWIMMLVIFVTGVAYLSLHLRHRLVKGSSASNPYLPVTSSARRSSRPRSTLTEIRHGIQRLVRPSRERPSLYSDEETLFDSDGAPYEKQPIILAKQFDDSNAEEADVESLSDDVIEIPMNRPAHSNTSTTLGQQEVHRKRSHFPGSLEETVEENLAVNNDE